jgi:hypothetical protein
MFRHSSIVARRLVRPAIFLIVATLAVVPALVRARTTQSIASGLRLNRGFDAPPSKWCISPPPATPAGWTARPILQPQFRMVRTLVSSDEALPHYLPLPFLDPLRGPPSASVV